MLDRKTIEQLEELHPQELGWLLLYECYKKYGYDLQYIKNLINAGAPLEAKTPSGEWTALHLAAMYGLIDVAKTIIAAKAPLEAKDHHGGTPLHSAARSGNDEVVLILLNAGASKEALNHAGLTPWTSAHVCDQSPIEELKPDNYE